MAVTNTTLVEFHNRIDNSRCEVIRRHTEEDGSAKTTYHLIVYGDGNSVTDWGPQSYHQVWESFRAVSDMALEDIGERQ